MVYTVPCGYERSETIKQGAAPVPVPSSPCGSVLQNCPPVTSSFAGPFVNQQRASYPRAWSPMWPLRLQDWSQGPQQEGPPALTARAYEALGAAMSSPRASESPPCQEGVSLPLSVTRQVLKCPSLCRSPVRR